MIETSSWWQAGTERHCPQVDNLWQTVQPGPFSENQAQELQAAVC